MAGKGTFAALQQLRPTNNIDFTKGIMDANTIYLRMNQDKRSEQTSFIEREKYNQERKDAFIKALSGDLSKIDSYYVSTGYKQPDEALTNSLLNTKQQIIDLYSSPAYQNGDPKAVAEYNRLLSKPKFLSGTISKIDESLKDLDSGMKSTVGKNGEYVAPKYSKAGRLQLDKWKGLANGQLDIESIDGRDYLVIYNDDGNHNVVDMNYLNTHGLKDIIPSYFDFNSYLESQKKNLGEVSTVKDEKGYRTVSRKSFEDLYPLVEEKVDKLLGGSASNITNEGLSLLADHYNYDLDNYSSFNDDEYNKLKQFIINQIQANYKEEYKDEFNKDQASYDETVRHNKKSESINQQNANTSSLNAQTSAAKVNHEINKDLKQSNAQVIEFKGAKALNYSLNKTLEVTVPGVGFEQDKKFKANGFIVKTAKNGSLEYYLTDGVTTSPSPVKNPQKLLDGANITAADVMNGLTSISANSNDPLGLGL